MDIHIYRSQTASLLQQKALPQLLQQLPVSLHAKALRYRSELSAYNYVVGRLLLKHGLEIWGHDASIEKIELQQNGKPTLPNIHFNISHSEHQVICAFSKEGALGVDLEKVSPVDFENFTHMFSEREWEAIKEADDSTRQFYWFWTRKESIIKALGKSLSYLHQLELDVSLDHILVEGKKWFLQDIPLGNDFLGALCCESEIVALELIEVTF